MLGHGAMVVPSCVLEASVVIYRVVHIIGSWIVSFVEVHLIVAHVVFGVVDVVSGMTLYMYTSHCI